MSGHADSSKGEMTLQERMLRDQGRALERIAQYLGEQEARRIVDSIAHPRRLEHAGRKVYSQGDEDGILSEILERIGGAPGSGIVIEFGVENGLQSNTHWLLRQGHSAAWLECDDYHVKWLRRYYADYLADGRLRLAHEFVTRDTVDARLAALTANAPVLVLSIDVDGNDYWIWERITTIRPAVVVIEYNATFPPPVAIVQEHDPDGPKKVRSDAWGASLSALDILARRKGYRLVGCSITGINAFFVRDDLATDERFPYACTPASLYHPLRRKLIVDAFASAFPAAVGRFVSV